ncbi:J domain-containing protein [Marinobacter sp. DUT-1]|uniref:J domain-containing protein n=1 Tax=Marinobacter sp. DUT-1 TaxID=3412037 RepID=UPI003D1639E5
MNCWEILGIEPTSDRQRIQQAYEQQLKFASGEEADRLDQAFREATGEAPVSEQKEDAEEAEASPANQESATRDTVAGRPLDSQEGQIVREVIIQIKALLNDSRRSKDVGIWKAILCEPPADKPALRREIAGQLEPQLRPMAENGSLAAPVTRFLGEWFDWYSLQDAPEEPVDERNYPEPGMAGDEPEQPPQMVNFWPAVIGWIVGLIILASIFGGMGGG